MIHIHPFPARMAPEVVLSKLSVLEPSQKVLDPMAGSGMVLSAAARYGLVSIGVDSDPLAVLISSVGSTKISLNDVWGGLDILLEEVSSSFEEEISLPWIDSDEETIKFIDFWFDQKQITQLRKLSYYLVQNPIPVNKEVRNILITAVSRLIITKEPKASLARDTAHSRPHRVKLENSFDIISALPKSLEHVLGALKPEEIEINSQIYSGDARDLNFIKDDEIDVILTSPPYLNAIDYMRGHKFSLVWFGYPISELRKIREKSIGSERITGTKLNMIFSEILNELNLSKTNSKTTLMIQRYFIDLCAQLSESYRVLKPCGTASFVIGNSEIKGQYIPNNMLLKKAANIAGLNMISEEIRKIPESRRYLPMLEVGTNSLSKRMRTEHIVSFVK